MNNQKCDGCNGRKWMTLHSGSTGFMDVVAPCIVCSGDRSLTAIEKERGMKLLRDSGGKWHEIQIEKVPE